MNVSLSWLRDYVDITLPPDSLAETLTLLGLEAESVEDLSAKYTGFVVGEVLRRERHPNADRLTLCEVNIGVETLSLVCGAPNVAAGQKVAVARVGAVVPRNQHDPDGAPFILQRTKIRGVVSDGMICSEYELDLGGDKDGILVLPHSAVAGTPLSEFLGRSDVVMSLGITANRPDCLSHIGVAREIAAGTGMPLRKPLVTLKESDEPASAAAAVEMLDPEGCPRYSARVVRGVRVGPSPAWLQRRLGAVGLRPINNVVDVTNYVLMEFGHPLHAFDLSRIAGRRIIVRRAKEGEHFVTLDGKGRTLSADTVMICDAERPVAVAGIMGGENSEISDATTDVLLESAYFNPRLIRRASKNLQLSTDASQRFERGADPNGTIAAADRAAQLILETAGGEILRGIIDAYPARIAPLRVPIRVSRTNDVLGTALEGTEIRSILQRLEFSVVDEKEGRFDVEVPTFRPDIEREIDLIEEVGRVHGLTNIPDQLSARVSFSSTLPAADITELLRDQLIASGWFDVYTNSMQDEFMARFGGHEPVRVLNPLSRDMGSLRESLVPGLLQVVRNNFNVSRRGMKVFEIGRVFRTAEPGDPNEPVEGIHEEKRIGFAMAGIVEEGAWYTPERFADLFDLKGEVESLFSRLSLDKVEFVCYSTYEGCVQPAVFLEVCGTRLGYIGKVTRGSLARFDIERDVYAGELDLSLLERFAGGRKRYAELPKYPGVLRDIALIVDAEAGAGRFMAAIRSAGVKELRRVRLFDVYEGERVPKGKKSLAFSLEFRSDERTLTDDMIDVMVRTIVEKTRAAGGELRSAGKE
ncbi:MAG: phenylalanine--tRNA ligase subunit beta [Ignavibacteriales bacterium CG07_land_8_20_14_0_80_59_12]|nr:MAG: phenylalanine--tRNA ligase subunit beta [Ignavibacteriales bacterium CG07_land_8_20_14_0_80_59_12]